MLYEIRIIDLGLPKARFSGFNQHNFSGCWASAEIENKVVRRSFKLFQKSTMVPSFSLHKQFHVRMRELMITLVTRERKRIYKARIN